MTTRLPHVALLTLCLVSLGAAQDRDNRLPATARSILEHATTLELLSLQPDRSEQEVKDGFHGWVVLGRTMVTRKKVRQELLSALFRGVADSDGSAMLCFNPRHGIRASRDGKAVELAVCFECLQIEVYLDGKKSRVTTTASPEGAFDKILTAARVPLAPKKRSDGLR